MMALARRVVSGDEDPDAETVEDAFARAREAEASADELLVDDGWKLVETEPETTEVNGNGNGHHDGIGPTVELVLGNAQAPANGNGHAPVPANGHHGNGANGNGHHEEAGEQQQSTFSWAEFMAEPVKPKRRNGKPQPVSMSMFEWAMEQERETVGAGR